MGASTLNKKELFRLHMGEVKNDYATLVGDCEYYESQIESLQAENDKLRELVRDFYPFVKGRASKPWLEKRKDRMRELGIGGNA